MGSVQIGTADAVASQGRLSYEKDEGARLKLKKKTVRGSEISSCFRLWASLNHFSPLRGEIKIIDFQISPVIFFFFRVYKY